MQGIRYGEHAPVPDKLVAIDQEAHTAEYHLGQADNEYEQKEGKFAHIVRPHAVVDPRAVVVVSLHATPTNVAVEDLVIGLAFALGAERAIDVQQILCAFLSGFTEEKAVQSEDQYLVDALEH